MNRTNYASGAKWEDIVGYSRAVRIGNTVEVTGTVAVDDENKLVVKTMPTNKPASSFSRLKSAGPRRRLLQDVVRTRMFVTDISRWEEYGRAHGEFFGTIKPCTR